MGSVIDHIQSGSFTDELFKSLENTKRYESYKR